MIKHVCTPKCKTLRYVIWSWCITHLRELIEQDPAVATPIVADITGMGNFVGAATKPEDRIQLITFDVDHKLVSDTDLEDPILVLTLRSEIDPGNDYGQLPVAGFEQIYKALTQTPPLMTLPGLLISPETEAAVRRPLMIGPRW